MIRAGDTLERLAGGDQEMMGRYAAGMGLRSMNELRVGQSMVADWGMNAGDAVASSNRFYVADASSKASRAAQQPDAQEPVWSFREASMAQRKLDDARALAEYQARLASQPMQYVGPVDVAAQRAAMVRRESLLNFLNGQGNMALGGVVAAGVMIGTGDVVVASQATDTLGPIDSLMAPMGGGSASRLGRARGSRPIDYGKVYEADVRGLYGDVPFQQRTYTALVNGERVRGVADNVTMLDGMRTAVEAKYVDNWATSLRNPGSPEGNRPWAVAEQQKMLDQGVKYSRAFDQTVYHTNSVDLVNHYTPLFQQAGVSNFKFVITPPITPKP